MCRVRKLRLDGFLLFLQFRFWAVVSFRDLPVSPALGLHTFTTVLCFWHGWLGPGFGSSWLHIKSLIDWVTSHPPKIILVISVLTWLPVFVYPVKCLRKQSFHVASTFFSSAFNWYQFDFASVAWLYPPCDGQFCSAWTYFYAFWSKPSLCLTFWISLCRVIC